MTDFVNWKVNKNGKKLCFSSYAIPLYDKNGNFTGYRGIDRNITEKTQLENQLQIRQRMDSIGTLASGIAHDFNNILSIIAGFLEMVIDADKGKLTT